MIELSVTITGLISAFSVCSESQCEGICLADKCFNMLHWRAQQHYRAARKGERERGGERPGKAAGPSCHLDGQGYSRADKHCFQRSSRVPREGVLDS